MQHPFGKRMLEWPDYSFFLQTLAIYPWLLLAVSALAVFAGHGSQMRTAGCAIMHVVNHTWFDLRSWIRIL